MNLSPTLGVAPCVHPHHYSGFQNPDFDFHLHPSRKTLVVQALVQEMSLRETTVNVKRSASRCLRRSQELPLLNRYSLEPRCQTS